MESCNDHIRVILGVDPNNEASDLLQILKFFMDDLHQARYRTDQWTVTDFSCLFESYY